MTTQEFRNIVAESEYYADFCSDLDDFIEEHKLDGSWEENAVKFFEDEYDQSFTQEELDEYIENHGIENTTTVQNEFFWHWYVHYLQHMKGMAAA